MEFPAMLIEYSKGKYEIYFPNFPEIRLKGDNPYVLKNESLKALEKHYLMFKKKGFNWPEPISMQKVVSTFGDRPKVKQFYSVTWSKRAS